MIHVSPIIWMLLGICALIVAIAVILVLHDRGLRKERERYRDESLEFADHATFKWEDQKKR